MEKQTRTKIMVYAEKEAFDKIDNYANKYGLSRSMAVMSLALEMLEQKEFLKNFPQLMKLAEEMQEKPTE